MPNILQPRVPNINDFCDELCKLHSSEYLCLEEFTLICEQALKTMDGWREELSDENLQEYLSIQLAELKKKVEQFLSPLKGGIKCASFHYRPFAARNITSFSFYMLNDPTPVILNSVFHMQICEPFKKMIRFYYGYVGRGYSGQTQLPPL